MTPASLNTQLRARALVDLVREYLPQDAPDDGRTATWPRVGFALIARAAGTLEALITLDPTEHLADCATLARSLYEYTVHLAWLAADPSPERLEEWQKDDLRQALTADRETRERGFPILEARERADLQARYERMTGNTLNLADLAVAADTYWTGKLPGIDAQWGRDSEGDSFRDMYAVIYRFTSSRAHASYRGTVPVMTRISDTHSRVHMEVDHPKPAWRPIGMGAVLLGFGLFICETSFCWRVRDRVLAVFTEFPG